MKHRMLIIPDLHLPNARNGALQFCQDLYEQWDCNKVIFIGDIVDWHSISFHDKHPECPGPTDEYKLAKDQVQKWYSAFPKATICIGNHDERVIRLAEKAAIPAAFLKDYNEMWETPKWSWVFDTVIDDVFYYHGTGQGGKYPSCNAVTKLLMSVVMGHNHTAFGIKWQANPIRRIFSMDVGCLIDDKKMAFSYGRHMKQRSVLGAGVVIDGIPYLEPMLMGKGEKYHDSKF